MKVGLDHLQNEEVGPKRTFVKFHASPCIIFVQGCTRTERQINITAALAEVTTNVIMPDIANPIIMALVRTQP